MGEVLHLSHAELLRPGTESQRGRTDLDLATAGFLARYRVQHTREGHACNLRQWFQFLADRFVEPFHVRAAHIELWARKLEDVDGLALSTVAAKLNSLSGFYKYSVAEEYTTKNPMENVTRPRIERVSPREGLTRPEFADLLTAARFAGPRDLALVRLLGVNGLRVSEACNVDIEHVDRHEGETQIHVTRKYGKLRTIPLSTRTAWAIEQAIGDRTTGPLFLSREKTRLDRAGANRVVKRLAKAAGITKHITPHSLRHTAITMALGAGVPEGEILALTDHADRRMISYYDRRNRVDLARNATSSIDAFVDRAQ